VFYTREAAQGCSLSSSDCVFTLTLFVQLQHASGQNGMQKLEGEFCSDMCTAHHLQHSESWVVKLLRTRRTSWASHKDGLSNAQRLSESDRLKNNEISGEKLLPVSWNKWHMFHGRRARSLLVPRRLLQRGRSKVDSLVTPLDLSTITASARLSPSHHIIICCFPKNCFLSVFTQNAYYFFGVKDKNASAKFLLRYSLHSSKSLLWKYLH